MVVIRLFNTNCAIARFDDTFADKVYIWTIFIVLHTHIVLCKFADHVALQLLLFEVVRDDNSDKAINRYFAQGSQHVDQE